MCCRLFDYSLFRYFNFILLPVHGRDLFFLYTRRLFQGLLCMKYDIKKFKMLVISFLYKSKQACLHWFSFPFLCKICIGLLRTYLKKMFTEYLTFKNNKKNINFLFIYYWFDVLKRIFLTYSILSTSQT